VIEMTSRSALPRCVVVGAGPVGLAAAAALAGRGLTPTVFEQGDAVGAAWRSRYERLRLNTSRLTSRVAGHRYPRGAGLFPSRDEFVGYLEGFAERHAIHPRTGVRVERIDRGDAGDWVLGTSDDDVHAQEVVVATGFAREPRIPLWPGSDGFERPLLHARDYRNAEPYRGRDVLVVGAGSSGLEIAFDLAAGGARRVWLSVRTPPNILLRSVGGVPGDPIGAAMVKLPPRLADAQLGVMRRLTLGDLTRYGLPAPEEGAFERLRRLGASPAIVDKKVVDAIRDASIEVVHGVRSLHGDGILLADGLMVEPDAVIAATGYRCGLEPMVGHLDVLDNRGVPRVVGGGEARPGLRFLGFVPVPGQIRFASAEASRAARQIARRHRRSHARGRAPSAAPSAG
jgi:cation diffusion facilitator CzcD-associated flavoprotein CzcO